MEEKKRKQRVHKKELLVPYPVDLEPKQLERITKLSEATDGKKARMIRKLIDIGLEKLEIPQWGYTISVYQVKKGHEKLVKSAAKKMGLTESQVVQLCIDEQLNKLQ